jgi:hypothetical protein
MSKTRECSVANRVAYFKEWASLFSECIFMILRVYADESGTNVGQTAPSLCGYIDTPDNWTRFGRKWGSILKDYNAPYFHFREYASKRMFTNRDYAYYGWSASKRAKFLYDLALQASESAIPTGGASDVKWLTASQSAGDLFESLIRTFFASFKTMMNMYWPNYDGKVLFIFDQTTDQKWLVPLHKIHNASAESDDRIGGLTFEDDKSHFPLQAADLLAYAFRQRAELYVATKLKSALKFRLLDFILYRNYFPQLRQLDNARWRRTIYSMCQQEKQLKAKWAREGNPKKIYYPEEYYPRRANERRPA